MNDLLSTGIEILDRKLDGGIPTGSIVALSAPPASQSELFLYELASTHRTTYLTTKRSEAVIRKTIEQSKGPVADLTVEAIEPEAPLDHAGRLVESLPESGNVIIDPIAPLERADEVELQRFYNTLWTELDATNSVAYLHCLEGRAVPDQRDITEYMADVVFTLSTAIDDDGIETHLTVPKFRGRKALEETIKLDLTEDITVDVSRNIA